MPELVVFYLFQGHGQNPRPGAVSMCLHVPLLLPTHLSPPGTPQALGSGCHLHLSLLSSLWCPVLGEGLPNKTWDPRSTFLPQDSSSPTRCCWSYPWEGEGEARLDFPGVSLLRVLTSLPYLLTFLLSGLLASAWASGLALAGGAPISWARPMLGSWFESSARPLEHPHIFCEHLHMVKNPEGEEVLGKEQSSSVDCPDWPSLFQRVYFWPSLVFKMCFLV